MLIHIIRMQQMQNKSMVGEIKYKNMDDDPVIDDRDRAIIGDTNPDYQYGLTSTMTYKDWTFSFFLQGIEGNDILNVNLNRFTMNNSDNVPYFVWNSRWTPKIGEMPNILVLLLLTRVA